VKPQDPHFKSWGMGWKGERERKKGRKGKGEGGEIKWESPSHYFWLTSFTD